MFFSQKLNARIRRLHERALRVVYKDFDSSFEELLRRDNSATLHQQNLQSKCNRSIPHTERYGIETASSTGPKLWDKITTELKSFKFFEDFKA